MKTMDNEYRPHLTIPTESEVEDFDNSPRGFSEDRDIDRFEHGSKLSTGLQDIVSAYTKIQSGDSLSDEDIRIFEIVLPEGQKLKDQRDFLEKEGMTINMVRDERRAVVSAPKSRFDRLQNRVRGYRDSDGSTKQYQFIDDFRFIPAAEKQARSLREIIERVGKENLLLDVQLMLMPKLQGDVQGRAEGRLVMKIKESNGKILAEPFKLSDGTGIIRAEIPVGSIEDVSNDTVICRVSSTMFLTEVSECALVPCQHKLELDPTVNISDLPLVVILDDGVKFPAELESIISTHWTPSDSSGGECRHGTEVASKAAFANVGEQLATGYMTPRARIIDCNIRDGKKLSEDTMIRRIKEAVETFHDVAKIYNFSSAAETPIEGDIISNLGYELDYLSYLYGVKFTIAAGNHKLYKTETSLGGILDDTDARIALPADSMLNISVGSVVGKDHAGSLSKRGDVAPYSRIGPGFCGMRKPDIVAYGGTILSNDNTPIDEFALMLATEGRLAVEAGTSFTAPDVAGGMAQILQTVPGGYTLMAETLLYHGAELPLLIDGKNKLVKDEAAYYGDCYGRGIPVLESSMYSSANRVTFIHSGTLNRKTKRHVKFLMPKVFETVKKQRKAKVIVTCVTQPPVDHTKGEEYLGAYVRASLHKLDGKGQNKSSNPKVTDGRRKWDTCYHFEEAFSSFTAGDWEVWLELFSRWDVENTQEVEYALAVTIEDLTKSHDIYNEIMMEAKGRFPAVDLVRIPVRR
jgi:hypothetical protein